MQTVGETLRRHLGERAYAVSRVAARPQQDVALVLPLQEKPAGTLAVFDIVLPYLPPSKNEYNSMRPAWQWGCKRKWIRAVVAECERQNLPKGLPKIGLMAKLVFPSRGYSRDPQNYAATLWNFVPDALEDRQHGYYTTGTGDNEQKIPLWGYGLIPDDKDGRISFGPNLGIKFAFDERKQLPKDKRKRTYLRIAVRLP